ncbi:hypothetical protein GF420_09275 [candidate division GN15 bacterium]|nr:hypothetical protein [candidate division GN15 bacterium]
MPKLWDNFWLKLTAVVLGLLIWLHVATEKEYTHEFRMPVTEVNLGDSLTLASNPPDTLRVAISGTGKQLLRKKWRGRGIRINASQQTAGRHRIALSTENVSLVGPTGELSLDEIVAPSQVLLNVDRLASVTLPVTGSFVAEPADGFAIATPVLITPDSASLHGPRSVIRRFNDLETESKQLRGLRDDVSIMLALQEPPMYGVSVEPESVRVELRVMPVKTRVFESVPVRVFNSPPDSTVRTVPPTVRIELTGPPTEVDALDGSALTVSADYRQRAESGRAAVKVDSPPAFRIRNVSTDSVRIVTN